MDQSILTKFSEQFPNLIKMISEQDMQRLYTAYITTHPNEHASQFGERLYFSIGSALAAQGEWNSMTFRQLEHEARVQGFLGPYEKNQLTEWKLRLKLACESRRIEEEERLARKD